jgi:poly(3-hydroxybutyrate) depolymerase
MGLLTLVAVGCSSGASTPGATGSRDAGEGDAGVDRDGTDDASDGATCAMGAAVGPSGSWQTPVTINGVPRSYYLVVPQTAVAAMQDGGCGVPLVIGLHGAGDTGAAFMNRFSLPDTAGAHASVLVAPDAINHSWYFSKQEGWTSPDGNVSSMQNDVELVLYLVKQLGATYRIDPARVYAFGMSRGGSFTGVLATASNNPKLFGGTYSSPFAAYGISAGLDAWQGSIDFGPSQPKHPMWMVHGTADMTVPFADGQTFADELKKVGWPVTFTPVAGAPHNWLWQDGYGQNDDDLWSFFLSHASQ